MKKIILTLVLLCAARTSVWAQDASTFHVFPQVADGAQGDGSFYVSTVLATNVNPQAANCTLHLYGGISSRLLGSPSFTLPNSGSFSLQATQSAFGFVLPLTTGYATLSCDRPVTALVGYLHLAASGTVSGAATVFPSPTTMHAQLLVNQTGGTRLALALANDTDAAGTYQVNLVDASGQIVVASSVTVSARSNTARFLDEIVRIPDNFSIGSVSVTSSSAAFSLIGLFFNGNVFFSQPATTFAQ
jgi:hypothetical protein